MHTYRNSGKLYLDTLAYISLLSVVLVGATTFIGSLAGLAEILFPASALLAALLLLWRNPPLYIGFMWWTWFLTPEVRRLADYHTGFSEQSPIMLTPFLVTGVALFAVLSRFSRLNSPYRQPLAFTTLGLLYAYGVGLMNNTWNAATFDLLSWGVPVIIGAYLLTHKHLADDFRTSVQRTFSWGLLVMGSYALFQYFFLPPWDAYWMEAVSRVSFGVAEPGGVRVFSTLNSPVTFATVVMAGLLLIFGRKGIVQILGSAAAFAGFALSIVRAAWGGWVVGIIVLSTTLPLRTRLRFIGILILLAIVALPLFTIGPVAETLSQRLQTLTDLENDRSFNDRIELYAGISRLTANNPLGQGLGSTGIASTLVDKDAELGSLDSGIIAVVYTFGILGTLYFVGGAAVLFGTALKAGTRSRSPSEAAYIGITVAALSQLFFSNVWSGALGMVLWFFPCLYLAVQQDASQTERTKVRPKRLVKSTIKVFKL